MIEIVEKIQQLLPSLYVGDQVVRLTFRDQVTASAGIWEAEASTPNQALLNLHAKIHARLTDMVAEARENLAALEARVK